MGEQALAEHLVLLARSGLMTHVAELEAPVTAATMARFRADASAQSSNVMALSPGEFALCLAPSVRALASTVPHRLRPIAEHPLLASQAGAPPHASQSAQTTGHAGTYQPDHAARMHDPYASSLSTSVDGGAPHPPMTHSIDPAGAGSGGRPRRILPSASPSAAAPQSAQSGAQDSARAFAFTEPPAHSPQAGRVQAAAEIQGRGADADVSTALEAIQASQDTLTQRFDAISGGLVRMEAAMQAMQDAMARTLQADSGHHLQDEIAALKDGVFSALDERFSSFEVRSAEVAEALKSATEDRISAMGADAQSVKTDVINALSIAEIEQRTRLSALSQELQAQGHAVAETDARTTEGLATLRLGLRAMNDRLAELNARIAPAQVSQETAFTEATAPEPQRPRITESTLRPTAPEARPPGPIAVVPPDAGTNRGGPDAASGSSDSTLRLALRQLLAELNAEDPPTGSPPAALPPPSSLRSR